MANEIKYQINGQLADNTVTVDNKEDMILVPVSVSYTHLDVYKRQHGNSYRNIHKRISTEYRKAILWR